MRANRFAGPAWVIVVLVVLLDGVDSALEIVNDHQAISDALVRLLVLLAVVGVGGLIVAREPQNRIGWLFCGAALLMASGMCAIEYAVYALRAFPGALPGGIWLALYGAWARDEGFFALLTFLPLIFPTGRLVSTRWRIAAWFAVGFQAAFFAGTTLTQFTVNDDRRLAGLRNPLSPFDLSTSTTIQVAIFVALLASFFVCGTSLYVRFRSGHHVERQQLKWFVYAVTLSLILAGIVWATLLVGLRTDFPDSVWILLIASMPVGTGIAILRYRLYDIDLIINRTLVYGMLTGILGTVYFGLVIGMQQLTRAVAGAEAASQPVIIVLSTLAIAALFTPLRHRIQRVIDRRFYRAKYDAARTLERFAMALRQQTDLAELREHLVDVVEETMQPAHVSLWLRTPEHETAR